MKIDIKFFVIDYLHTAAWVTCDAFENMMFTREAKKLATEDCKKFIEEVEAEFGKEKAIELLTIKGKDLGYMAAHDFFLTRNGHGAGFWDRPEKYGKKEADKLTEISQKMGGVDCYHIRGPKSKLCFD